MKIGATVSSYCLKDKSAQTCTVKEIKMTSKGQPYALLRCDNCGSGVSRILPKSGDSKPKSGDSKPKSGDSKPKSGDAPSKPMKGGLKVLRHDHETDEQFGNKVAQIRKDIYGGSKPSRDGYDGIRENIRVLKAKRDWPAVKQAELDFKLKRDADSKAR